MPPRARAGQVKGNADDVLWRWLYSASCDVVAPGGRARGAVGYPVRNAASCIAAGIQTPVEACSAAQCHRQPAAPRPNTDACPKWTAGWKYISDSALPHGGGRKGRCHLKQLAER